MVMATPTISKKQAKNTLSGKKKKTEVIKNVLAKPYQNYWPLLSPEDNNQLTETLERFLPRIKPSKVNIPYKEIKQVPKDDRKRFRESKQTQFQMSEDVNNIIFGVNDVTQLLEKQEAACVLVASDVQPRLLVQHVLDQAVLYSVPALVVRDLRTVCRSKCGVSGAVVGLKKGVKADSELGLIQQSICNLWENYPVPESHINYHRKLDVTTITIPDSEDGRSVCMLSDSEAEVEEKRNYHLTRTSDKKRAFVPEKSRNVQVITFIDLDSSTFQTPATKKTKTSAQYHPLSVKRVKGNKNRNKRKMEKLKNR